MIFGWAYRAMFPLSHRPHRNPYDLCYFRLCLICLNTFQKQLVTQVFDIDWNQLSRAKSL